MTLADAGPLVALIDTDEFSHERCRDALAQLSLPLVTTWAAFTEATYLLGEAAGWPGQRALWRMVDQRLLAFADLTAADATRSAELMERYRDHPMDLADATLVAVAEARGLRQIFTLDDHFRSYRLRDGSFLEVVPAL